MPTTKHILVYSDSLTWGIARRLGSDFPSKSAGPESCTPCSTREGTVASG